MREREVKIEAWSGAVRPWRARVFVNGKHIGSTGGCKSEGAARQAAEKIREARS